MTRIRSLVVVVLAVGAPGVWAAAAQACDETWKGGNGSWGTASAWNPEVVPTSGQSVCITAAGTYTVVLPANGGVAKSLTVGGPSGVQTVDVVGESWDNAGDTSNETALGVGTASFAANTKLILEATGKGTAEPKGAGGYLIAGTVNEAGQIEAESSDPQWADRIKVGDLRIEPGASLLDASGTLMFIQEGEGSSPWSTTNEGTFTVAPGASTEMQPSFAGNAGFINAGAVVNEGSITGHGAEWAQQSGSVSGNPVVLQNGSTLADSAGTGSFLANYGTLTLTGTIPAGQTVMVRGEPFNYQGENFYSTTLSGGGKELINDGTLVLNPTGSGEVSGGGVNVEAGSIHNNGLIDDETETATRVTQLLDGLSNGPSGRLQVNGGIFQGNNGAATTNEGLVTVAPGAVFQLQEGASFVNEAGGTFSPQIASASSFGTVQLSSPCCSGSGVFTAAGAIAPTLVGGFVPATGQEFQVFKIAGKFNGTFGAVANGFTADYSHESSESPFVGVVYGTPAVSKGGPAKVTATTPVLFVKSISGAHEKITVRFSCPVGGASCGNEALKATVTEHLKHGRITAVSAGTSNNKTPAKTRTVVIASASVSLVAGATKTLTLELNATGRALLAKYGKLNVRVTISSGAKTLEQLTVHVVKASKPKKK